MLSKFAIDELLIYGRLHPNCTTGARLLGLAMYEFPDFVLDVAELETFIAIEYSNLQLNSLLLKVELAKN